MFFIHFNTLQTNRSDSVDTLWQKKEGPKVFLMGPSLNYLNVFNLRARRGTEIETVRVHHFIPGGDKVIDELLL